MKSGRVKFRQSYTDKSGDTRSGDHLHSTTTNRLGDLRGETNFEGTRKRIELNTAGIIRESQAMNVVHAQESEDISQMLMS